LARNRLWPGWGFNFLSSGLILAILTACGLFSRAYPPAEPTRTPVHVTTSPAITPAASRTPVQLTSTPAITLAVSPTLEPAPTSTPYPTSTSTPKPLTWSVVKIPAPSLNQNLLNEPQEQTVKIYLPPSYSDSNLHYPVVYFLPGYGGGGDGDSQFFSVEQLADLIARKQLTEMILVVPNGANVLHGSFYVNSPVTGNWEDFISRDVVDYIDSNYRTIPRPDGRGIGGHSMGGFGALNLAMHHPDLFGASYSLSSAFFDEEGLSESMMFDKEKKPYLFLEEQKKLSDLPEEEAIKDMTRYDGPTGFTMAYGAAFAPNPELGPPFFDYPYELKNGKAKVKPEVWSRWENGLGGWQQKISEHHDNLTKLRGIVIDYGTEDIYRWIPPGSEYLSRQLSEAGIQHQIYRFDGGHGDHLEGRLIEVMLPFFDRVLVDPYDPDIAQ